MRLPTELRELSFSTDIPFHPKREFGRLSRDDLFGFGKCYESRYKGHVFRYYKGGDIPTDSERGSGAATHIENRLKLYHSRPLNLGLQCYFNVNQLSPFKLVWGEGRNLFASKLRTSYSDIKCYAAEKKLAEKGLSQERTIEAFLKLRDFVRNLGSGRFVVVDQGLMIFFEENPDESMLAAMHQFSTILTEFPLLPHKRTYWALPWGFLCGLLIFLLAITLAIIYMRGSYG